MTDDMNDLMKNTWTFAHTDCEGVTTTSSFEADTWPRALQQFVNFLKGAGFAVDGESIAINGNKHLPVVDDYDYDSGWYGEMFYPDEVHCPEQHICSTSISEVTSDGLSS